MIMADNQCIFFNWIIKGDVSITTTGEKKVKRATFAASPYRPNQNKVWNKNYFVAFGEVAELIEKIGLKKDSCVTLIAEQQVYIDDKKIMRHNYKLSQVIAAPSQKKDESPSNERNNNEQKPAKPPKQKCNGDINGYDEMMSFMNS